MERLRHGFWGMDTPETSEIRTVWAGPMIMSSRGELICDVTDYVYDHAPACGVPIGCNK